MARRAAAVLVLGLLLALPALGRSQGQVTACKSNLKNLGTALEMYGADNGGRYPSSLSALTPRYLKQIPTCAAAGADTYSAGFVSGSAPDRYAVYCLGHHHARMGLQPNRPSYDSVNALVELGDNLPRCESQLEEASRALALYRQRDKKHRYPKSFKSLSFPTPPSPILYDSDGSGYTLMCGGALHLEEGIAPFSPSRTSSAGLRLEQVPPAGLPPSRPGTSGPVRAFVAALAVLSLPLAWAGLRPRP